MKFKIILTLMACGLSLSTMESSLRAVEQGSNEKPQPPDHPPDPDGGMQRFLVQAATASAPGMQNSVFRIDTFTGCTWRLANTPWNIINADGTQTTRVFQVWEKCLEADGMEWIRQQNPQPAPGVAPRIPAEPAK
jgi:hypothetical protein